MLRVHRRRHQHRRGRRQIERRQEVVGDAVGELADDVRRRRRDQQQVGGRGQRDVLDVGVGAGLPLIGDHLAPGDRLEGQRTDEALGRARHDRGDVVALLLQAARDLDRLVGADAAGTRQVQSASATDASGPEALEDAARRPASCGASATARPR